MAKPEWPSLIATSMWVKRLGCHAIQCTPLLVEMIGVTRDVTFGITASTKECRQEIQSGLETHEEGHMKSKTGAISDSTKWALLQQNFQKILRSCAKT